MIRFAIGWVALGCMFTSVHGQLNENSPIDLEPVWVRIGDSYGKVDVENVTESVECAVFSPCESKIASGAKRGWDLILWETESGDKIWEAKAEEEIEVVAFTSDGEYVVSGGEDKKLRIWDSTSGKEIHQINNVTGFDAMDVHPDRNLLAAGDEAGQILLFDTRSWERTDLVHQGPDEQRDGPEGVHSDVNQLHFSNDGQWLLSAGRNREVKLWRLNNDGISEYVRTYHGHSSTVKSVRLSPDGKWVAAGAGGGDGVRIWDFESGSLADHIPGTGMIMETVAFTPDSRYLLTGGNEGEGKIGEPVENPGFENKNGMGHIRAYRVPLKAGEGFELVMEIPVFRQEFFDFSDDGALLVTSHEDGTVRLWRVKRKQNLQVNVIR